MTHQSDARNAIRPLPFITIEIDIEQQQQAGRSSDVGCATLYKTSSTGSTDGNTVVEPELSKKNIN